MPKKPALTKRASQPSALLAEVRQLILSARESVARAVNASLALLYWQVGSRVRKDILGERRAEYGAEIIATLSRELSLEFGCGFDAKNLARMVQFAESFSDPLIVATLSRQLGWSHFKELLPMKDRLKREFYAEMCRVENWSVRKLRQKIGGMLFERTALSKKPEKLLEQELQRLRAEDHLSPDLVFRDPYFLDFLVRVSRFFTRCVENLPPSGLGCADKHNFAVAACKISAVSPLPSLSCPSF